MFARAETNQFSLLGLGCQLNILNPAIWLFSHGLKDSGEGPRHGPDLLLRIQRGIVGYRYAECAVAMLTDGYGQLAKRLLLCLYGSEIPLPHGFIHALRYGIVLESHHRLEQCLPQVCLCLYLCQRTEIPPCAPCRLHLQLS